MTATGTVGTATRARAAPAWRARVSRRHLVVALAGLVGVLVTLSVVRAADRTVPVLALRRAVASGERIGAGDLTVARVRADAAVLAALVRAGDRTEAIGRVAEHDLAAGDVVRTTDLQRVAGDGTRSMSFALDSADALAGRLARGDDIDVLAVNRDGTGAGYVLVGARVVDVDAGTGSGPLRETSTRVTITVALDAADALRLSAAQAAGRVTIVRSTGARAIDASPRYEPQGTAPRG